MAYCKECGTEVTASESFCKECGTETAGVATRAESEYVGKSKVVAVGLAVFLGWFGAHKFYLGKTKHGLLYAVFFWTTIPFFLGIYDGIKYLRNDDWEFDATMVDSVQETAESIQAKQAKRSNSTTPSIEISDDAVMMAEGVNGQVILFEDRLRISRENIGMIHKVQHGFSGDKEIPYESITSVQIRKPSSVTRGYIQFGQSGYSESDDGLFDATSDENSVLFEKDSLSTFMEIRDKVQKYKKGDIESSTGNMDEAMQRLRERYAEGEIDEEEFNRRKEILQQ